MDPALPAPCPSVVSLFPQPQARDLTTSCSVVLFWVFWNVEPLDLLVCSLCVWLPSPSAMHLACLCRACTGLFGELVQVTDTLLYDPTSLLHQVQCLGSVQSPVIVNKATINMYV